MTTRTNLKLLLVATILAAMLMPWTAHATIVFTNFGGDSNATFPFPNITVSHDTGPAPGTGLADFTGSAFGITSAADTATLESSILAFIQADFAPYDVSFATTQPGGTVGTDFVVWGIDDTAFTFTNGGTPEGSRLYGKVDALFGTYARTWGGSMSLDGITNPYGGSATSSPQLDISTHTIAQIALAMANSAAHEIAHLFGVLHEGLDGGGADLPGNLMQTDDESVMASTNKAFSSTANSQLLSFLGASNGVIIVPVPEPSSALLLGAGLVALSVSRRRRRRS